MKDFYNTLQTTIKKHIIDNYGNYLSNDMKNLLMEKNYINDLTLKISNLNEVFNHLVYIGQIQRFVFPCSDTVALGLPVGDLFRAVLP